MRRRNTNIMCIAAIWAALVVGSYALHACCYQPNNTDACRNVLSPAPDTIVDINGEECDITTDSSYDDLVGWNFETCTGFGTMCAWNTTYCNVAYDCPSGTESIEYYLPSGPPTLVVVYGSCPNDCQNVFGCGDCQEF